MTVLMVTALLECIVETAHVIHCHVYGTGVYLLYYSNTVPYKQGIQFEEIYINQHFSYTSI